MRVQFTKSKLLGTRVYAIGEFVELADHLAKPLIRAGLVEPVKADELATVEPPVDTKPEKPAAEKPAKKK